jgi:RNA polymerase sigma factor (TIGR02999 family)
VLLLIGKTRVKKLLCQCKSNAIQLNLADSYFAHPRLPRAKMSDITQWLQEASAGDQRAIGRVFDRLYPELRRIAGARFSAGAITLSPTVLVHESYLRLFGSEHLSLKNRAHFLACAGRAMRLIVIDHMRQASAQKRGGGNVRTLTFEGVMQPIDCDWITLSQALEKLHAVNADLCELVELHFFAGVEFQEIAALRSVDERTVRRHWQRAKAILHQWL